MLREVVNAVVLTFVVSEWLSEKPGRRLVLFARRDASTKALKTAITARGVACRTCSQREHFVDRLLDVVHLPVL